MTSHDRSLVEDAFRAGIVTVLTCTTTLSAGINLPANNVIIKSLEVGKTPISPTQ